MLIRPTKVKPLDEYKLFLEFNTGEKKIFDVLPYISGPWFGQLQDKSYFEAVKIVDGIVTWPEEQDIAPHELYDDSIPANGNYSEKP